MKSETIFRLYSTWRGRWGDEQGSEIVIEANFDNPASWPFYIKRYNIAFDDDTYEEIKEEIKSVRISKAIFDKIKSSIANNKALEYCEEEIENEVRDGTCESFIFSCDKFTKNIGGLSILSCGYFESEDLEPEDRTANYVVRKAYDDIIAILESAGIDIYA